MHALGVVEKTFPTVDHGCRMPDADLSSAVLPRAMRMTEDRQSEAFAKTALGPRVWLLWRPEV